MNLKSRLSLLEKGSHEGHPLMLFLHDGQKSPEQLQQIKEAEINGRHVTIVNIKTVGSDGNLIHKNAGDS